MAIVKMKRVAFLTLAREGDSLMRLVQRLGVMHPEHIVDPGESPAAAQLEHRLNIQRQVLHEIRSRDFPVAFGADKGEAPSFDAIESWIGELRSTSDKLISVEREIAYASAFGEFEPHDVEELAKEGVFIQAWSAAAKDFESLDIPAGVVSAIVGNGRQLLFATASCVGKIGIAGAEELEMPRSSLSAMRVRRNELSNTRDGLLERLGIAALHRDELEALHAKAEREYDFQRAHERAFRDEAVMAFEGWIPAESAAAVQEAAARFKVPVVMNVRDPLPDETPPVLTRNPWIARVFEPLLHLLGFPEYRGVDPAMFFAPFMMLFFGICMGDVGYGVAMIIAALIFRKALLKKIPQAIIALRMTLLFGVATIIWGTLTGSLFGAWPFGRETILLNVAPGVGDPMLFFKIAMGLGVVHMSIALILAIVGAHTWGERIMKTGSLCILIGGVMLVVKFPAWQAVLGVGVLAVLVFSSNAKNPLIRLGLGVWGLYGHVGLLGDVMSYSRLFGLGLASCSIASVVNMLAGSASSAGPILGSIAGLAILVGGHFFNLVIGIVGSLVHSARLHAVEAMPKFAVLDGEPYSPLRLEAQGGVINPFTNHGLGIMYRSPE